MGELEVRTPDRQCFRTRCSVHTCCALLKCKSAEGRGRLSRCDRLGATPRTVGKTRVSQQKTIPMWQETQATTRSKNVSFTPLTGTGSFIVSWLRGAGLVFCLHICKCTMWVSDAQKIRRGCGVPETWRYHHVGVGNWTLVLMESKSALNQWAISSAFFLSHIWEIFVGRKGKG